MMMEQKTISLNTKKLSYKITGEGDVVVLIHGFGEDNSVWRNQIEALNQFRLILPNLPGSGASELQDDMSMEGLAESVYTILQAENVTSCVMIGHSMGGYVTLAFAEKYGDLLRGFGLFHSTAYADTEEKKATRRKGIDFIRNNGAFAFLKTTTPNLFAATTKEQRPQLVEEQIASLDYFTDAALISYYESMMQRPDRTAILRAATQPVLLVLGTWDNAVPLKDGLAQAHLASLSYIHVLRNSGHMGMMEEQEKANQLLIDYLTNRKRHHPA